MSKFFFITGAARSGTTLIDKLCHNLPGVIAASQPYHQWYVDIRNAFFAAHPEFSEPVPLFHHFPARPGWHRAFLDFLLTAKLDEAETLALIDNATCGKGQSTPGLKVPPPPDRTQSCLSLWKHLQGALQSTLKTENARLTGSKEIYCEDFAPFLVSNGVRCVFSIRDIRDVVTSMNYGSYREATGLPYPLLMNVRNWRKSVATALALRDDPHAMLIRYEDVVASPGETLARMNAFLQFPGNDDGLPDLHELVDQQGNAWQGNSSFGSRPSISDASVGRWRQALPEALAMLIEYLAGPELAALGYPLAHKGLDGETVFNGWRHSDRNTRPDYKEGNELDEVNLALEVKRRAMLQAEPGPADEEWFLYERAATALRAVPMADWS